MKRLLQIIMLLIMSLSASFPLQAKEFGEHPERARQRLVVTQGKKLNVRSKPSVKGTLIYQLRPGDIIYVDSIHFITSGGYEWLPVTDKWGQRLPREAFVTNFSRFRIEDNPLYDPPSDDQKKIEDAVESSQLIAKWILLLLSIAFAAFFLYKYFSTEGKEKLLGYRVNGMRRTFFFNSQPYTAIIFVTLFLAGAVAAAVVSLITLGAVVYGLLWLVKILCYILVWVGIIMCVGCAIAIFSGDWKFIIGVILGGVIWYYDDKIEAFAEASADTGLKFFNEFNILNYSLDITLQYWKPVLTCIAAPIALFLALAVIWLLIAGILILLEKIVTGRYNIKHPCPHCHQPSEPARYLSKSDEGYLEIPNDIKLRPGMYGLFHITHPVTLEKMPTMIMNGRDKLARACANCGNRIQADEGTEVHLAMVGSPQAGKSTLTYRIIAELFSRAGEQRVSFTDVKGTIKDRQLIDKVKAIAEKNMIEDANLPSKTALNDLASTQLIIRRNHTPVPYRLFINDVGGELFDIENQRQSQNATRFFHDIDSILFLIDPLTTDFSDCEPSPEYAEWVSKCASYGVAKLKVKDLQDTVDNQIKLHGNSPKRINLNIVLPKIDMDYLPADIDINSQEDLRRYLIDEMGLGSFMHWAGQFRSVSIFAVGAMASGNKSNIAPLIDAVIIGQLGIRL
ncbi:MAG: hypothetical protein K2K58_06480 [Muribaculaceae bacterium]|nr:hypothetical protein [Muribaculaceae bacterium]